jgi:hypothetical protein
MKTFEKNYGNLVVTFNNTNEYVEMGPGYENPVFEGILVREKFSDKGIEFYKNQIEFFLKELRKIGPYDRLNRPEPPLLKLIHRYGYENYNSDFVIVISDYDAIRCKFFIRVSHQFNGTFDAIRSKSPEFKLEEIVTILEDAESLIENKEAT